MASLSGQPHNAPKMWIECGVTLLEMRGALLESRFYDQHESVAIRRRPPLALDSLLPLPLFISAHAFWTPLMALSSQPHILLLLPVCRLHWLRHSLCLPPCPFCASSIMQTSVGPVLLAPSACYIPPALIYPPPPPPHPLHLTQTTPPTTNPPALAHWWFSMWGHSSRIQLMDLRPWHTNPSICIYRPLNHMHSAHLPQRQTWGHMVSSFNFSNHMVLCHLAHPHESIPSPSQYRGLP